MGAAPAVWRAALAPWAGQAGLYSLQPGISSASLNATVATAAEARNAACGAAALGPSVSLAAREDVLEAAAASASVLQSLKDVELTNGRWAMLGFLAAILVEAGTGRGIIEQCITYLKVIGILGPMSGF